MAPLADKLQLLHGYMATRRRIREIERKAMSKLDPPQASTHGPFCSFCNAASSEVAYFVESPTDARICDLCVRQIADAMNYEDAK